MSKYMSLSRPVNLLDTLVNEKGEKVYSIDVMKKASHQHQLATILREVPESFWNDRVEDFKGESAPLLEKPNLPLPEWMKVGSLIKVFNWTGIVKSIYTSQETGAQAVLVYFVKNIFKGQTPELMLAEAFQTAVRATPDDLQKEYHDYETTVHELFWEMVGDTEV